MTDENDHDFGLCIARRGKYRCERPFAHNGPHRALGGEVTWDNIRGESSVKPITTDSLDSLNTQKVSINYNDAETITIDHDGVTYHVVERDGGLALERE